MMKKLFLCLLLLAALLCCCGCEGQLAPGFDEDTVIARAEEVANLVIDRDYEEICQMFRDDVAEELSPEYLSEQLDDMLDANGEFKKIRGAAAFGQTSEDGSENYAMAIVLTKFEHGKRSFTVSFDEDMELIGLYMK